MYILKWITIHRTLYNPNITDPTCGEWISDRSKSPTISNVNDAYRFVAQLNNMNVGDFEVEEI